MKGVLSICAVLKSWHVFEIKKVMLWTKNSFTKVLVVFFFFFLKKEKFLKVLKKFKPLETFKSTYLLSIHLSHSHFLYQQNHDLSIVMIM